MKFKYVIYFLLFCGCSVSKNDSGEQPVAFQLTTENLTQYTIADGSSSLKVFVTLKDTNNEPFEDDRIQIIKDGEVVGNASSPYEFITTEPGLHVFQAKLNSYFSETLEINARSDKNYEVVEFPLIFHIPKEDIDETTGRKIEEWVALTNERFNRTELRGFTKRTNSVPPRIVFRLSTVGRNGQILEIPGVNPYPRQHEFDFGFQDWMWHVYAHPDYVINIWLASFSTSFAGFASYPILKENAVLEGLNSNSLESPSSLQGIVLKRGFLLNSGYLNNNTLEHELGHFFGLRHIFPCDDDDFAEDTFQYSDNPGILCNNTFLLSFNAMSYEFNSTFFTYSQRERMRYVIDNAKWIGQKRMVTIPSANGVNPPSIPKVTKPKKPVETDITY